MDRPALVVEMARRLARVELDDRARTLAEEVAAVNASAGEDESLTGLCDAFDRVPELRTLSSALRRVIGQQDAELARKTTELLQRFRRPRSGG